MAAACGHTETVEVLLAAGAEVNVQNKVCTSPNPVPTYHRVNRGCWCAATGRVTTAAAALGCHAAALNAR
jgi:ankyrin repeat protein